MIYISIEDFNALPSDYKGTYSSDSIRGTNLDGRRTWLTGRNGSSVLLIEGENFVIVAPDENDLFESQCDNCEGSGSTEHDTSTYSDSSPQSEYRKCYDCEGSGVKETQYDGY